MLLPFSGGVTTQGLRQRGGPIGDAATAAAGKLAFENALPGPAPGASAPQSAIFFNWQIGQPYPTQKSARLI